MFEAIIPLRSKSRGLKNKNILLFKNRVNLVNYTLNKLIKIKEIKKIYILTDSILYKKKIIQNKKIDINYLRKKQYSNSKSKIDDLINDFLKNYNRDINNKKFLLFQVTSPNLGKEEIIKTINFINKKKISSLMHVTKILENPYEVIETNKKKWSFLMKKRLVNRQSYPKKFMFITGSLYFFTRNFFLKNQEMINSKTYPYKVDRINFVDIDDLFTFELSKQISSLKIRD
jgi:CMP-N-acetylneuraminic acid synthetase